eukprot:GHVN01027325.1.p1 GENE.GHVN01027325.1~~GHVN01027325.1.p1  ORF type:complete len:103 (+),score=19.47 GHVN01027325.1:90-398(+)
MWIRPERVLMVIKGGTFCRTMWPLFIPLCAYKYIRQTDGELYALELLKAKTGQDVFFNPSTRGWTSHWRIQNDLNLLWTEAHRGGTSDSSPKLEQAGSANKL